MAAEKVVNHNARKITGDMVATRTSEKVFTPSKLPGRIRKTIATGLIGLTLASTTPQLAFAGGQDEKGKDIVRVIESKPMVPMKELQAYCEPGINRVIMLHGEGKSLDGYIFEADKALKRIGLDVFPESTESVKFVSNDGDKAGFLFLVPGANGLMFLRLSPGPAGGTQVNSQFLVDQCDVTLNADKKNIRTIDFPDKSGIVVFMGHWAYAATAGQFCAGDLTDIMKELGVESIEKIKVTFQPGYVVLGFPKKDGTVKYYGLSLEDGALYAAGS